MEPESDDYWTGAQQASQTLAPHTAVALQTLPIVPLDAQFGAHPLVCMPSPVSKGLKPDPQRLFAIIDAARIDGLAEMLEGHDDPYQSLFRGDADDSIHSVAPYLVQLHAGSALLRHLFTRADGPKAFWDREAFVLLQSEATIDALSQHFRRFTHIMAEHGSGLYFRFWDAQILRRLMQATTQDFSDPLLLFGSAKGPRISCFVMPDPAAGSVTIATAHADGPQGRFMRSDALMQVLQDHARARFALTLIRHCAPRFPETFARLSHDAQIAMMMDAIRAAERLHLTKHGTVTSFMEMRLVLGVGVADDPMYPWVAAMLDQVTEHSQMAVIEALVTAFSDYDRRVNGPRNAAFLAALRRARTTLDAPAEVSYPAMLARVFPEKFDTIGPKAAQAFLAAIRDQLSRFPGLDPQTTRAYILLCYFMGHRCAEDPQYAWIGPTLNRTAQANGANSALVRKCHTWLDAILGTGGD